MVKKKYLPYIALFIFMSVSISCGSNSDTSTLIDELTINAVGLDLPYAQTVTVQNYSDETFVISANGSKKFSTPLKTGDTYSLSIVSQSILQNCNLTPSTGIVSKNGLTVNLTCADKTWTYPTTINDNISITGRDSSNLHMAMDNNDNAILVWIQTDYNGNNQIFKSEYRDGSWIHPTNPNDNISPDGQNVQAPHLAMDNNGNAIITWTQYNGSNLQIFKSEYRNGSWTHPTDLSDNITLNAYDADNSNVAMDNAGNAIITWTQSNGSNLQIFKSEYRNGAWTHPTDINDYISPNAQNADNSNVTMDNNGNAIITWIQSDGSNTQIFKSEYRNGSWTHPTDLSDNISPNAQDAQYPDLAMDNNGNAIITWTQSDGNNTQIFKSEYRNGSWTHPTDLSDNISPNAQDAQYPDLAMDNNGNAIITWTQSDGNNTQIFKSEYRNSAWIHPSALSDNISPNTLNADNSKVSMDNHGNAIIVWKQFDFTYNATFKSKYRNGSWTHPTDYLDDISPNGGDVLLNQVMLNDLGNALISWVQNNGDSPQVFISEFQ